jgi:hypothetical protein
MRSARNSPIVAAVLLASASHLFGGADLRAEQLYGAWELVGLGDTSAGLTRPESLTIELRSNGECVVRAGERDEVETSETPCTFSLTENVLEMRSDLRRDTLRFRVSFDVWELALEPIQEGESSPSAMRFTRRSLGRVP